MQFDPSAEGVRSTTLSIVSNDTDESTYNFALQGTGSNAPPPASTQIIDNGDAGFSQSGFTSYGQGYLGDIHFTAAGNGSDTATWTFDVIPGEYEIAATWTRHGNRAKDAPYTILNGSTPLATIDVNQEQNPNDFSDAGGSWERLGTYNITGSQLVVRLTDDADQYVIADAIRIEKTADPPPVGPEINVLGNSVSIVDGDTSASTTDDTDFGNIDVDTGLVTHTFTIQNLGNATLTISSITVSGGQASEFTLSNLPSSVSASGTATFNVALNPSALGTRATTLSIVSNDTDETIYDFAIQGTGINLPPPPTTQILDNGDAGFSAPGFTSFIKGYQNDIHFAAGGNGSNIATWTFTVTPGQYDVATTWTKHSNRATDAPFTILNGGTALATIDVDQEQPPSGFGDQGVFWDNLGNYTITGSQLVVRLTNDANQYVIADAIRIERTGNAPAGARAAAAAVTALNGLASSESNANRRIRDDSVDQVSLEQPLARGINSQPAAANLSIDELFTTISRRDNDSHLETLDSVLTDMFGPGDAQE